MQGPSYQHYCCASRPIVLFAAINIMCVSAGKIIVVWTG